MREAPSVEEAHQLYGDSLTIIGVAWSGDVLTYNDFIDEAGLSFPNIDDTSATIYNRFGVPYQPAAILLRPDGSTTTVPEVLTVEVISQLVTT